MHVVTLLLLSCLICKQVYSKATINVAADPWRDLWVTGNDQKTTSQLASEIIPESDLRDPNRRIWIITTACLPWMTGTSINPLLRAAYLAKDRPHGKVTLLVPWLERDEQDTAFPPNVRFDHPDEQEEFVKKWLIEDAHLPQAAERLDIRFYSARYHDEYHSIFPMGDITALIPEDESDVCVLEEPEHLNWYRAPFTAKTSWMEKFKHVIGIIHTNYLVYTRSISGGAFKEPLLYYVNQGMCRAYCHKIIKLSGALQEFAAEKEVISNVHGVREKYLQIGDKSSIAGFSEGAYFVGKLAWPKGLGELFKHMNYVRKRTGKCFHIDIFGQGPHSEEITHFAEENNLPVTFHGAKDHSLLTQYKVFVNPSVSEVLCTTIVEALAMGKWVICTKHPSNVFFEQFPNCLLYTTDEEFAANVYWALHHDPKPLSPHQRYTLSWEAATERFLDASLITVEQQLKSKNLMDKFCAWAFEAAGSGRHGDLVRLLGGAKSASNQIEYVSKYGSALPIPLIPVPVPVPAPKEHSPEHSEEHSAEHSPEHFEENSKEHSEENSTEHSEEHSANDNDGDGNSRSNSAETKEKVEVVAKSDSTVSTRSEE